MTPCRAYSIFLLRLKDIKRPRSYASEVQVEFNPYLTEFFFLSLLLSFEFKWFGIVFSSVLSLSYSETLNVYLVIK